MQYLRITLLFIFSIACLNAFVSRSIWANDFKVMTFNTMCDLCGNSQYDQFQKRKKTIKKIIEQADADLYSLQEIRSEDQLQYFFQNKKQFQLIYWKKYFLSYADPALAINTERFQIIESGHFWLGPNKGAFSLGWKFALPRQVQWVKLHDKINSTEFIFIGSHFDNRVENMIGSAKLVNQFTKKQNLPVIFAADTNCTVDYKGYHNLIGSNLSNSFDGVDNKVIARSMANQSDKKGQQFCYLRKGESFPSCRVDHILYSSNGPWTVSDWQIVVFKDSHAKNFPSDHRPVTATFSY